MGCTLWECKFYSKMFLLLSITVFLVWIRFSSAPKQAWRAIAGYVELKRRSLRGRRPVRADPRWRTDEKHIRAPSRISEKNPLKLSWVLSITVFSVRMCFSSVQKTRLARAARKSVRGIQRHLTVYVTQLHLASLALARSRRSTRLRTSARVSCSCAPRLIRARASGSNSASRMAVMASTVACRGISPPRM